MTAPMYTPRTTLDTCDGCADNHDSEARLQAILFEQGSRLERDFFRHFGGFSLAVDTYCAGHASNSCVSVGRRIVTPPTERVNCTTSPTWRDEAFDKELGVTQPWLQRWQEGRIGWHEDDDRVHGILIQMLRQGQLHEYAVDSVVIVQLINK